MDHVQAEGQEVNHRIITAAQVGGWLGRYKVKS